MRKIKLRKEGDIANFIISEFVISGKSKLALINIGTDRFIGDCLAPLVGTKLLEFNEELAFAVYGTLDKPNHALNLSNNLKAIKAENKDKDTFYIGIDACLSDEEKTGVVIARSAPISPGKGVGKKLEKVGDCSIIGIVEACDSMDMFSNGSVRLSHIFNMANKICKELNIVNLALKKGELELNGVCMCV